MAVENQVGRAVLPNRYVDSEQGLAELIAELSAEAFYAIDTEFHRERTYYPRLALVQVAWQHGIAVVDPLAVDVAPFAEILQGPGLAVLHAADQDLEVLERACGCGPRELFDTQVAAGFMGFSTPSLASLVDRLFGLRLEKGDQLTDWTRRPLSQDQLTYAQSDVAYLLEMYEIISAKLAASGRLDWAKEECARLLERSRATQVPEHAWWKLRQARQLRGKERGIAQQVAAWRERRAQEIDQPARFVLSDLAIVSIAHRPPKSAAELESVRTIESRQLGGGQTAQILQAVQEGAKLNPRSLEPPPDAPSDTVVKAAVSLAAAWAAERARVLEIDPAIFATRADVVAFLKEPPEGRLVSSWRHDLVGEPIRRLLSGKASIALDGSNLVLEERSGRPLDLG